MDSTGKANSYLALREAKIARNEQRLRELGLLQQPSSVEGTTSSQGPSSSKRKKVSSPQESGPTILRRSSRHRGEQPASYQDELPERSQRKTRPRSENDASSLSESHVAVRERPPASSPSSFPNNSARVFHLDVERLLMGTKDGEDGALGQSMERTGKAFVMEESARRAVSSYTGGPISFNKYSGVQPWGNNVLFLWINLNPPQSEVLNEFPSGGRQVTWYGGSRMHSGTPVIQKLIHVGKEAEASGSGGVVLWCRQYVAEKKTFGPYVCFGRLTYESHEPESQPLTFVWNLRDYDSLCNHKDEAVRDVFHNMVT
jgi:hypothetical protein